jgi:hypothetical protein
MAEAPDRSPRPEPRAMPAQVAPVPQTTPAAARTPEGVTRVTGAAGAPAPRASLRPVARPGSAPVAQAVPQAAPAVSTAQPASPPSAALPDALGELVFNGGVASQLAIARSLRPLLRPAGLEQRVRATATRQTPGRVAQPGNRGALCGVPGLVGDQLEPITGRSSGCGVAEPVRLRAVDGVALSTPATVNCETARALQTWVQRSLVPTVGRTGGGVSSLRVVASYACRTRNSQSGARISEHGRGNAIDIAGIGLANGTELTVLTGWRDRRDGRILRQLHSGACGPFGTVLGPNSDRFHQDHFHFDVASYRSGPYCR